MIYPDITQYLQSIRDCDGDPSNGYFDTAAEQGLRPVLDGRGRPIFSSGNFAVVFKMQRQDGSLAALKCFTKDQPLRHEAYKQISDYLRFQNSPYLLKLEYLDDELWVDTGRDSAQERYPVVLMEWVEGEMLSKFLQRRPTDGEAMRLVSWNFCQMAHWMVTQPFAHGDIKPDNIIVRKDGSLVLVDYDGFFVPGMEGRQSFEKGSPGYQHPLRTDSKIEDFDAHTDDFSLALMAMSLRAIALEPTLLAEGKSDDGLLLGDKDFRNLGDSAVNSRLLKLLYDNDFASLYGVFLLALGRTPLSEAMFRNVVTHLPQVGGQKSVDLAGKAAKPLTRTFEVGGVSFTMCLVEHGSFMMGATAEQGDEAYDNEHPVHKVNISRDYYIGQTQVTQALWEAVMGDNPSKFKGDDQRPVECVSWDDCQKFIGKLNERISGGIFALPTEAEWEFAARGGNKSKGFKYAGGNAPDEVAWFNKNANGTTHRVGQKKANELGLHDMSGNVWEWCADWHGDYDGSEQTDPAGPGTGGYRVLRGGSYYLSSWNLRVSHRGRGNPRLLVLLLWIPAGIPSLSSVTWVKRDKKGGEREERRKLRGDILQPKRQRQAPQAAKYSAKRKKLLEKKEYFSETKELWTMQIKIFTIPIDGQPEMLEDMNLFLRSHKILSVESQLLQQSLGGVWTFCVRYLEGTITSQPNNQQRGKVDYREVLPPEQFAVFCQLRSARKRLADNLSLPAFAIMTDVEMAELTKLDHIDEHTMKSIKGINKGRIEKFGKQLLALLEEAPMEESQAETPTMEAAQNNMDQEYPQSLFESETQRQPNPRNS